MLLPSYSSNPSSVLYKHFLICIKCIYLQNKCLINPYAVGKDKKSLAMVLPVEVVKGLEINPQSVFLLLEVIGKNKLQLQIIRESDLAKREETEKAIPVAAGRPNRARDPARPCP